MVLRFFYDHANGNYRCSLVDGHTFTNVRMDQAKEIIRNIQFDKIKMNDNEIRLVKSNLEVIMEDIDKCNLLVDILKQNSKLVNKELKKDKITVASRRFPYNLIKNQRKIAGGLLVITISAFEMFSLMGSSAKAYPLIEQSPYEKVMDMNEELPIFVKDLIKTQEEVIEVEEEQEESIEIEHGTALDTDTYKNAYNMHHESVERACRTWGMDSNLIMAMLTQESAGIKENLMQIVFSSFEGGKLSSYNFDLGRRQTYFFTDNPEYTTCDKYIVVRSSDLKDKDKNIFYGTLIARVNIDNYQNKFAGVLAYNQGPGNMNKIFAETERVTGLTKEDQLANNGKVFGDYAYASHAGDKNYLANVFRYFNGNEIVIKENMDGEIVDVTVYLANPTKEQQKQY